MLEIDCQLRMLPSGGSFWWRDILKLINKFKGLAVFSLQDGQSCFLWHDLWATDICSQRFPELFSFAKNTMITVSVAATTPLLHDLFHLALSRLIYDQFLSFSNLIQGLLLQNFPDTWTYIWGASAFASNKAYKVLIGHRQVPSAC
jgi:hypothetical protein